MCEYYDDISTLRSFGAANSEGVGELLFSFFDYFAWRHDYNNSVVSVRVPGGLKSKAAKGW